MFKDSEIPALLHLSAIIESSDDAIISKNLNGTILTWNKGAERIFGYSAEEMIGKEVYLLIPQVRHNEEPEIIKKIVAGQRIDHFETVRKRKDGSSVDISLSISPIVNAEGVIVGASKIARDITDKRKADMTAKRLAAIVESSDDAIVSKDLNSVIASWNKGAERIFGYTADEAIGKHIYMLFPEERKKEEPEIIARILKGERIDHYDTIRRHKNGSLIDVSLTVSPIKDANDVIIGASKIARDISERKKWEQIQKENEDRLSQLASELENRVQDRTKELEVQAERLRQLTIELTQAEQKERRRLAELLHDHLQQFLVAAKMRLDSAQKKSQGIDLTIIQEAKSHIEHAITASRQLTAQLRPPVLYEGGLAAGLRYLKQRMEEQHGIHINLTIDKDTEPNTDLVKVMIYQCIQELIFNAVKYAKVNECFVEINRLVNNDLQIKVEDKGIGFDVSIIEENHKGTFGLFSIRERMTALEGTFKIISQLGQGACFMIVIPDAKINANPSMDFDPVLLKIHNKENGIIILIADDHPIMRQSMASLLNSQNFVKEVIEASNGEEAVRRALESNPHVILMDANMPEMNGIEATYILSQKKCRAKIIGLSIHPPEVMADAMKEVGAIAYFSKGDDTAQLIESIKTLAANF